MDFTHAYVCVKKRAGKMQNDCIEEIYDYYDWLNLFEIEVHSINWYMYVINYAYIKYIDSKFWICQYTKIQ